MRRMLKYPRRFRRRLLTIIGKSEGPCFICEKREKTVDVKFKDKSFAGTLCLEHVYQKLKEQEESKEK